MAKSVLWLLWKEPVFQGDYFGGNSFLARYCSRSCFATRWFERKKRRDTVETLHNGFLYLVEQTERWPWYQEKEEETRSSFDVVEDKREKKKKEIYYRRSNIRCPSRYPRDAWPIFLVRHIQRAFFHSPFSYKRETRVEKKIIYRNGSTLMYNAFLLTNEVFCRWRRRRKVWKQLRSSLKRNSRKD